MAEEKPTKKANRHKKNTKKAIRKMTVILSCVAIFMFAFSYMMVPIFTFVCQQVGINGKGGTIAKVAKADMQADLTRTIKVTFASTVNSQLPFKFVPLQHQIEIHPGERKLIYFYAENQSGTDKTVQAIPSITPADAARFLKKIECFCFTQQFFSKNEKADMFVNFYIDPDVSKEIKEITLSYTLLDISGNAAKKPNVSKGRIKL